MSLATVAPVAQDRDRCGPVRSRRGIPRSAGTRPPTTRTPTAATGTAPRSRMDPAAGGASRHGSQLALLPAAWGFAVVPAECRRERVHGRVAGLGGDLVHARVPGEQQVAGEG